MLGVLALSRSDVSVRTFASRQTDVIRYFFTEHIIKLCARGSSDFPDASNCVAVGAQSPDLLG